MHIGGAHLHGHAGQPMAGAMSASAVAAKRAEETRKKLFASSEELDATATAESAWMIGAWSGSGSGSGSGNGGNGDRHSGSDQDNLDRQSIDDTSRRADRPAGNPLAASSALSELTLEQSAIAGAQAFAPTAPTASYGSYAAPARVEKTPETRQVSYWA